jgi:RES domain-containing protein
VNGLPPPLGDGELVFWRLDRRHHAATWDGGEGAARAGGRWNPKGQPAVYAALDPATAILEVAVHRGFVVLDTDPHVLTRATITDPSAVRVLSPDDVPNPNWLTPARPSAGQQAFGAALLAAHPFVLLPSVVSRHSWNLIFDPARAAGPYGDVQQEPFALDPRLHPAP